MSKERVFHAEYAKELIEIAANDLIAARTLAKNPQVRRETVFFNAQQAIEKALKALLCHRGQPVPMTHDIARLLDRFGSDHGIPRGDDLSDLSDFAAVRRYEQGFAEFTDDEISDTFSATEELLTFCKKEIHSEKA